MGQHFTSKVKDTGASHGFRVRQKMERSSTGVVTRKQDNHLGIWRESWKRMDILIVCFSDSCASYLIHVLLRGKLFPTTQKGISNKTKTEGESLNHHNFPKHEAQVTFNLSTGQNKRKRKKQKQKQNSIKNITLLLFVKFVLR